MRITPEQAFNALKILCPDLRRIGKLNKHGYIATENTLAMTEIDWGSLTEWPPTPRYVDPTEKHIGQDIQVRNAVSTEWVSRKLIHVFPEPLDPRFACKGLNNDKNVMLWKFARVFVTPTPSPEDKQEYVEPNNENIGQEVEVRDNEISEWSVLKLAYVFPGKYIRRFACDGLTKGSLSLWKYARIPISLSKG